jgi:ATP phosphoribosyltransferase
LIRPNARHPDAAAIAQESQSRAMPGSRSLMNGNGQLKLALQRSGRLTDASLELLRHSGLHFESYGQRLFSHARNFPLSILYARDDDISDYVALGTVDLGIVGRNLIIENEVDVEELVALGFGFCELVVAVPADSDINSPEQLLSSRIATSYPVSAKRFFESIGGTPEIIEISGSVEVTPALGVADAIVELTATGSSLRLNDLRAIHTIHESEAVLIANKASMADPAKRADIHRLLLRVNSVIEAGRYKYIMMNAPKANLDEILRIVPGLKAPTVVPLATEEWVAVHTAIAENVFWEKIEELRGAGASEILVTSLDKFLL